MSISFVPTRLNDLVVDVSLTSVARGDLLYRGASKWNNLAAGTSGYVLTSNGAGADPSWQAASGGAPIDDATAIVKGSADATKLLRFEVDGFTTGTTRVLTPPNANCTIAGLEVANVFTAAQSCPGAGSNSERFGASTTAAGLNGVAIGNSASALGSGCVAIGKSASADNSSANGSVAIGKSAVATGDTGGGGSVVIGGGASSTGSNNVVVGALLTLTGSNGTLVGSSSSLTSGSAAIGNNVTVSNYGGIGIGQFATSTHIGATVIGGLVVSSRRNEFVIGHGPTSGSGSNTGGHRIRYMLESSTGDMRDGCIIDNTWATATDASRKGRLTLYACDASGTDREGIRVESDGSLPMLGFYGVTAITRAVLATGTGATVDNVITALQNLGLVKQS